MKEQFKYRFNYFIHQIGVMFFPYIALYLKDRGYNGMQYGAVMSFTPIVIALTLPLCGLLDKGSRGRKTMATVFSFVITASAWLMIGIDSLTAIIIAVFFASAAKAAITTSIDGATTVYCVETGQEFSRYRSFSSLGYIAANLVGAFLYDKTGFTSILVISSVGILLYVFGWSRLKPLNLDAYSEKKKPDFKLLMKNKAFLMFLVYQTLCFAMMTFINNYDIVYQKFRDLPSYVFGITTLIRVGVEILTFYVLSRSKLSYKTMLVLAPVFFLIQSILYYFLIPTDFIYFLMCFAGMGSGLVIFANNKYLNKIVRPINITIGLYISAMVQNLFTGAATLIGGAVIDALGIRYIFMGSAITLIAAFIFTIVFIRKEDGVLATLSD
ncbi:MAG: MFS transporter [Clostridiales bacterium]|jgi:predicted MFS family arabinose efflux permease|nr:MFS transporter [Clostridiales bacterium]